MLIYLLNPFHAGSHQVWAEGYQRNSQHEVQIYSLRGKYWKWRMQGGAIALAEKVMDQGQTPDLVLGTDMLDLCTFQALTRKRLARVPMVLYFHENQLTIPWSPDDPDLAEQRDRHYAFINYRSALAADALWFNSHYHRSSFHQALPTFLRAFPDCRGLNTLTELQAKSHCLPVGLNFPTNHNRHSLRESDKPPLILWNHRWEQDKNPELFFRTLIKLAEAGLDFRLAVLGESYARSPAIFAEVQGRLAAQLVRRGFLEKRADYWDWLRRAHVLPVTAHHDFFGLSVVEAIAAGVWPLLPRRLAYPEHLPVASDVHWYDSEEEFESKLRSFLINPAKPDPKLAEQVRNYHWDKVAPQYDQAAEQLVESRLDSS
ncbi:MAG: DUF3524 domain-containing protein [Bacteroidota bacterium]